MAVVKVAVKSNMKPTLSNDEAISAKRCGEVHMRFQASQCVEERRRAI
jgi:hypothetical protein